MQDPTEQIRQLAAEIINEEQLHRAKLEELYGQVWNTQELQKDFQVLGFGAPFVIVRRKSDGVEGSLLFQHSPRFYWGWAEDRV